MENENSLQRTIFVPLGSVSHSSRFEGPTEEQINRRGIKGPISKDDLLLIFENNGTAEGFVIDAKDIMAIVRTSKAEIKISDSIIIGGLYFVGLKTQSAKNIDLPKDFWVDKRNQILKGKELQIVENKIWIKNSLIRAYKGDSVIAQDTYFKQGISFDTVTFEGLVSFAYSILRSWSSFYRSEFKGIASFEDAHFFGTDFNSAIFIKSSTFVTANFMREAMFMETKFVGKSDFSATKFQGDNITFMYANFEDDINFSSALFKNNVMFENTTFNGKVNFIRTIFNKHVSFRDSVFSEPVTFRQAEFWAELNIMNTNFRSSVNFQFSKIRYLNFENSYINVVSRMDFRYATISACHFENIVFEKDTDFSDTKFGFQLDKEISTVSKVLQGKPINHEQKDDIGFYTVFRFVTFEQYTSFIRSKFYADTAFERVTFKDSVNLTDAEFKNRKNAFSISYMSFENLIVRWNQFPNPTEWVKSTEDRIKTLNDRIAERISTLSNRPLITEYNELEPIKSVLEKMEAYFRSTNKLDDANTIYAQIKNEELKIFWNRGNYGRAIWLFLLKTLSRYNTSLRKLFIVSLCINLLFALLYSIYLDFFRNSNSSDDGRIRLRPLDTPSHLIQGYINLIRDRDKWISRFKESLSLSTVLLYKIGRGRVVIHSTKMKIMYICIRVEYFLGYIILISFVVTLYNSVPVIYEFLKGIF